MYISEITGSDVN